MMTLILFQCGVLAHPFHNPTANEQGSLSYMDIPSDKSHAARTPHQLAAGLDEVTCMTGGDEFGIERNCDVDIVWVPFGGNRHGQIRHGHHQAAMD